MKVVIVFNQIVIYIIFSLIFIFLGTKCEDSPCDICQEEYYHGTESKESGLTFQVYTNNTNSTNSTNSTNTTIIIPQTRSKFCLTKDECNSINNRYATFVQETNRNVCSTCGEVCKI